MKSLEPTLGLQSQLTSLFSASADPGASLHCSRQSVQNTCLLANDTKFLRLKENKWGNQMVVAQ